MPFLVDTSRFQPVAEIDGGDEEETALLRPMAVDAERYVRSFRWCPPIRDMYLAFGIGKILALFLVRFERAIKPMGGRDRELWIVVGDLPSAYFVTEDLRTPGLALEAYCDWMEHWANTVLEGGDLSVCYPVNAAPTKEHAEMLLGRVGFVRTEFLPFADDGPVLLDRPGDGEEPAQLGQTAEPG